MTRRRPEHYLMVMRPVARWAAPPRRGKARALPPLDLADVHLLIVEDDSETARSLARDLATFGHTTAVARDGRDAIFIATDERFDAIVLDRMLPLVDGIDVVKRLRGQANFVPLLMLTALGDLSHRIEGFESGADDYVVKPIDPTELNARLNAISRRSSGMMQQGLIEVRNVELNVLHQSVKIGGKPVVLKPIEFRILKELLVNVGQVVTRTMLLESVWGYYFEPDSNIVDMHIHKLRAELKQHDVHFVETVRGAGYVIRER